MAPIVLQTEVNCKGCVKKIEKTIKKMPGVTAVRPYVGEGRVVVEGTADAEAVRARLESKLKKPVVILSTGVDPPPPPAAPAAGASSQAAAPPPPPRATHDDYEYTPYNRHPPHYNPSYFSDDNPKGCCVQ
ncbi:heavy metal-associated isoprenylated plant protein 9-like [Oryza brachyantha]|uniref:heavy metal-associated isoprenylated plant protein 9-like n=1 Tax=Oryza brachyantha TaxID=4533 RepID=UPI001ADA1CCA|nr:heavy metal-associated isoprenylated plant protein 9-like [Oryza brachyantha]